MTYRQSFLNDIGLLEIIIKDGQRVRPEVVERIAQQVVEEGFEAEEALPEKDLVLDEGEAHHPELTSRLTMLLQPIPVRSFDGFTTENEASDRARVASNGVSFVELLHFMLISCHGRKYNRSEWKRMKQAASEFQRQLDVR